jgi:hypothetical protein
MQYHEKGTHTQEQVQTEARPNGGVFFIVDLTMPRRDRIPNDSCERKSTGNKNYPMIIPYEKLSPEALNGLIE